MWRNLRRAHHTHVIARRGAYFLLGCRQCNALFEGSMQKMLKLTAAIGGAVFCGLAAQNAAAQTASNNQLIGAGLKQSFSASDVADMMAEFPIETQLQPDAGDATATVLAVTPGGARFLISLFQCDDAAQGSGCKGAAIFTGFSNAGVTYDELNDFNSDANVTRVVNVDAQNIIVFGTQLFFSGGIGRDNFKFVTELFLSDMQNYVEAQATLGTAISHEAAPAEVGKIDNLTSVAADAGTMPPFLRTHYELNEALGAAVSNTWDVRFTKGVD